MCIIAIKPLNKPMFDEETIKTMFKNNPHGAGIMFTKPNGQIHIEKGFFKVEEMLKYISDNKEKLDNTNCVMHFRIATSGKKDDLNCHPYPVWQNNKATSVDTTLAMCHNGVLDGCGYHGNDDINDTQVFIKDCLRKLPHNFLNNKAIIKLIGDSIGTNKLAFLDKEGIHTIGNFIEDNGYYFSNDSYKPRVSYWGFNRTSYLKDDEEPRYKRSNWYDEDYDIPKTEDDLYEAMEDVQYEDVDLFNNNSIYDVEILEETSKYNNIFTDKNEFKRYSTAVKQSSRKFPESNHSQCVVTFLHYVEETIRNYIKKKNISSAGKMLSYSIRKCSYYNFQIQSMLIIDNYSKIIWELKISDEMRKLFISY